MGGGSRQVGGQRKRRVAFAKEGIGVWDAQTTLKNFYFRIKESGAESGRILSLGGAFRLSTLRQQ